MTTPVCEWVALNTALSEFYTRVGDTTSQKHIRPLHWYVACRLVLEGGFLPEDVTPHPPFKVERYSNGRPKLLRYDPSVAGSGELSVLGGLKTKQVDVTVCKAGIGPVIAVSMKGTHGAFRNLTNRMEEAVGDCTNLHLAYPALVYGFLHVVRGTKEASTVAANDVAVRLDGSVSENVDRYADVLDRLAGRNDVRDVATKYESIGLALVEEHAPNLMAVFANYPRNTVNPVEFDGFFERLYRQYDERFVYAAPALKSVTTRLEWNLDQSIASDSRAQEYQLREA